MSLNTCNHDHDDVAYDDSSNGCPVCAEIETKEEAKAEVDRIYGRLTRVVSEFELLIRPGDKEPFFTTTTTDVVARVLNDPNSADADLAIAKALYRARVDLNAATTALGVKAGVIPPTDLVDPEAFRQKVIELFQKFREHVEELDNDINWES